MLHLPVFMPVFHFYNFKILTASRIVYWEPGCGWPEMVGLSRIMLKTVVLVIGVGDQDRHKSECIAMPFGSKRDKLISICSGQIHKICLSF